VSAKSDVVIVGAGVMGCAIAYQLARQRIVPTVLERSVPGAEASSAAAGMLGAQVESHAPGPFVDLCIASRQRFGDWAGALRDATGIDVEHRVCGVTKVAFDITELDAMEEHAGWQRAAGLRAETLRAGDVRAREPEIARDVIGGVHFPDEARVDPPRFLKALRIAAERAGATFRTGAIVRRLRIDDGRARGVELEAGEVLPAAHVVLAAGSWSTLVGGTPLAPDAVRPARGQIVELLLPVPIQRGMVLGSKAYLSPRDDGRVLVGSTLEFVGFDRGVTAGAVRDLLAAATRLVPRLESADLGRAWSSFRPYTANELPMIGACGVEGLSLATGHFRNGILLSPITAEIVAAGITGSAPPIDPAPFAAPRARG
jgi:glycine oxidase